MHACKLSCDYMIGWRAPLVSQVAVTLATLLEALHPKVVQKTSFGIPYQHIMLVRCSRAR